MAEITRQRTGQFLQVIFKLLETKPDGMPAKDVLAEIPKVIKQQNMKAVIILQHRIQLVLRKSFDLLR